LTVSFSDEQNRYFWVTIPNSDFAVIIRYFLSVTRYPLLLVIYCLSKPASDAVTARA